jgi:hypothetical protein
MREAPQPLKTAKCSTKTATVQNLEYNVFTLAHTMTAYL